MGSNSEFETWGHWINRFMRCTIIIHWKIQVVVFHFLIQVNIAIRKYLLHRKTSMKQIITTTLNRSKKGLLLLFKSPLSPSTVLVKGLWNNLEPSHFFPYISIPFLTGFLVFRKICQNIMAPHQCHITYE